MRRLVFTAISMIGLIAGWNALADEACTDSATEIPIVAKFGEDAIVACKFSDGWHIKNGAGEQVVANKDGGACVVVAGKGNQLCCPQTNTSPKVEAKNSRFENGKGTRFECGDKSKGEDEKMIKISKIDDKTGNPIPGTDIFKISGSIGDKPKPGSSEKQKAHMEITQTHIGGGAGGGSNDQSKDATFPLDSDVGSGKDYSQDSTCDETVKCKATDLIANGSVYLDDQTHKYMQKDKQLQPDRNGEKPFSADAANR